MQISRVLIPSVRGQERLRIWWSWKGVHELIEEASQPDKAG